MNKYIRQAREALEEKLREAVHKANYASNQEFICNANEQQFNALDWQLEKRRWLDKQNEIREALRKLWG